MVSVFPSNGRPSAHATRSSAILSDNSSGGRLTHSSQFAAELSAIRPPPRPDRRRRAGAMWLLPQARAEGLAASAGRLQRSRAFLGVGLGVAVSFLCLLVIVAGIAIVASVVVGALPLGIAKRQIGGVTGDVLGAAQILGEVACLIAYMAGLNKSV